MKIVLIGASGFVGGYILTEALNRGHYVTGIVRNPEKLINYQNFKRIKGDVYNEIELSRLITGHDAVISAFNPGWGNQQIRELSVKGTRSIINAVKISGVKRILIIGGAGSLEIQPGKQLVDTPDFPQEYKDGALGAREALNILKKEDALDWSFVSPSVTLKPDKRTGKFRLGEDALLLNEKGESIISTQDLAMAIIDEIENPHHIKKRFTVGY
jgi:uncharacterized protein